MAIVVADLIDAAKAVADKRGDASIPDPDWLRYVNWGIKSLDRFIARLDPAFRFASSDFTLSATPAGARKNLSTLTWLDPDGVALPAANPFAALHGLDLYPDTNRRRTIRGRNFHERNIAAIGTWVPTIFSPDLRYDLRSRTLVVTPYESATGSYRAYARLGPYLFTSALDATVMDYQLEPYDEFVVDIAARRGLNIEESNVDFNNGRLAELRQEIIDEHSRDDGQATQIADVEGDCYDGDF